VHKKSLEIKTIITRALILVLIFGWLQAPSALDLAKATDGTLDLQFGEMSFLPEADLTEANANLAVGFSRRYADVADINGSKVDARVSITLLQHRSELNSFDEYDNSQHLSFHTAITDRSRDRTMGRLRVDFLAAGTENPVVIRNLRASVADIDEWEFAEFKDISSYKFASPTDLRVGTPAVSPNFTQFLSSASGSSNTDQRRIVEVNYDSASSISFQMGCRTGAVDIISTNGRCGFTVTIGTLMLTGQTTATPVAAPSYTLTYDGNLATAGSAPAQTTASGLQSIAANTGNLSQNALVFAGWNTAADGTGLALEPGASYVPDANITLYAQYAAPPTPYAVTFNPNGGTGTMADQISSTTADLTLEDFTRDGYEFLGWNTAADGSGTAYVDGDTYAFTADMTLYAQWKQIPKVTFESNGGTGTMADQTSPVTADLTPQDFTRDGFEFVGWNTAADGSGELYADGASYPFTENLTLYAQWVALTAYTVTYVANDGTGVMQPQTSSTPESLTSNLFSRDGYTFVGWNTEADGSGTPVANASAYDFSADMTLYAQWTPVPEAPPQSPPAPAPAPTFTVTYFANGGAGVMQAQVSAVPLAFDQNLFARAGFTFQGWNTDPDGSGASYGASHIFHFESDLALYAQWLEDPVIALPEEPAPGPQALANTGDSFATGALLPLSALAVLLGMLFFRVGTARK
jgi:uncharacterized repeat protein (TIGR02543 family)